MLCLKLGWRNIFRNKKRTLLCSLAIGIGLAALIITDGFMIGMKQNMIKNITQTFLGDFQIHRENFRTTLEIEKTINQLGSIENHLKRDPLVSIFTKRIMSYGMISSAANVSNIILFGVDGNVENKFLIDFETRLILEIIVLCLR